MFQVYLKTAKLVTNKKLMSKSQKNNPNLKMSVLLLGRLISEGRGKAEEQPYCQLTELNFKLNVLESDLRARQVKNQNCIGQQAHYR